MDVEASNLSLVSMSNENDLVSCHCVFNVVLAVSSEYLMSHHPAIHEQARAGDPTRGG
jgi:hypothetical protein